MKQNKLYNTISLPTEFPNCELIRKLQKQSASVAHISYERFWEDKSEKEIRNLFASGSIKHIELLDSWLINSILSKVHGLYDKDKKKSDEKGKKIKTVFGGKKNFNLFANEKITKKEYLEKRLYPIISYGEACKNGNRKFEIDFENNLIIFKYSRKEHFIIQLPKLRKNNQLKIKAIQIIMENCIAPISFELSEKELKISVEETILQEIIKSLKKEEKKKQELKERNYTGCSYIVCSVDQNPEGFGICIKNYKFNKILFKGVIGQEEFTKKLGLSSSDKKSKYQVNKQHHELIESCKWLISLCKHYHVGKFVVEDLQFKPEKDKRKNKTKRKYQIKGNKEGNRLCKNKWNRGLIVQYIKKYCILNNIEVVEINPVYSSFIGNLTNNEYDPIAAAMEIGRRGFYQYQKGKFYPSLIDKETLRNRWKKDLNWTYQTWKELFEIVKNAKMKYRNSLENYKYKLSRLSSDKSCINLYSFI